MYAADYNWCMQVVRSLPRAVAATTAQARRRWVADRWIAGSALAAALLALPLAQTTWHGAEVSAILAIAATAMLAGQRWAIAPVVVAELFLLPTLWPRAFTGLAIAPGDASAVEAIVALISLAAIVPGVLAMRRAAAAFALVTGWRRTRPTIRRVHVGLVATGLVSAVLPLL